MNESVLSNSENRIAVQEPVQQISGGAMLRKAREAAGLHIAALAVSLKVPVKKLEALETDQFDLLPDVIFVRALAASVCRALKIDPAPILEQLPHTVGPRLKTDETGINTPFRVAGYTSGLSLKEQLSKPFPLAVLLLLVGALVLVFIPFPHKVDAVKSPNGNSPIAVAPMSVPLSPSVGGQATAESSEPPVSVIAVLSEPSVSKPSVVEPSGALANVGSNALIPAASSSEAAATGPLVFKAHGVSWVEVVDATGVVRLRKTMADGETVGTSGVMPLTVVVGRADTIEVQVRGKPVDLTQITKDNVARFEVK